MRRSDSVLKYLGLREKDSSPQSPVNMTSLCGEYVQGSVFLNSTSPDAEIEVIPGKEGKILYITHLIVMISEWTNQNDYIQIRDGSEGYAFINYETGSVGNRWYEANLGERGYALTQGNGLFSWCTFNMDITTTALGYYQ